MFEQELNYSEFKSANSPKEIRFGLECEFQLCDKNYNPLWWDTIDSNNLIKNLESINVNTKGDMALLQPEQGHSKISPYLLEGYFDKEEKNILCKGIEIRTPVFSSLDQLMDEFHLMYHLMKKNIDYIPFLYSYHLTKDNFLGPRQNRRYDYWKWACSAMSTFGPDINISVPHELMVEKTISKLNEKFNYYSLGLTAISLNSPIALGTNWKGLSKRVYKRSLCAPIVEYHLDEGSRIEFKMFDAPLKIDDFKGYFYLCFALLTDPNLKGEMDYMQRIYSLGDLSLKGFNEDYKNISLELITSAKKINAFEVDQSILDEFEERVKKEQTPAHYSRSMFTGDIPQFCSNLEKININNL